METNTIFSGSTDNDEVYQFTVWTNNDDDGNVGSMSKINTFAKKDKLEHPAGLAVYNNSLYVASQKTARIVEFDITTNEYLGTVVSKLGDDLEDLVISWC